MKTTLGASVNRNWMVLVASACLAISLCGCKGKGSADLSGRYTGQMIKTDSRIPIVADVKVVQKDSKRKLWNAKIEVYEVLASAKPAIYEVQRDDRTLQLFGPQLPERGIVLPVQGGCGGDEQGEDKYWVCLLLTAGKIQFSKAETQNGQPILTFDLNRDDQLPEKISSGSYSLDQLLGRARFSNYKVAEEAERVYRARQEIQVAIGNLLPHLTLRSVIGTLVGEQMAIIDAVGNLVPFLFPRNWYHWDSSKHLYRAEKASFGSLRGNEMNAVETMFYEIFAHRAIMGSLDGQIMMQEQIYHDLRLKEDLGLVRPGTSDYLKATIALKRQDRSSLEHLVEEERVILAQAVGISPLNAPDLLPILLPDMNSVQPITAMDLLAKARLQSLELKSLRELEAAAKANEKEVFWSFLDPQAGTPIGYGTPFVLKIARSNVIEIQKKIGETDSLLEERAKLLELRHNRSLEEYFAAAFSLNLVKTKMDWLMKRYNSGEFANDISTFLDKFEEADNQFLALESRKISAIYDYLIIRSAIDRVLTRGFYVDLETGIPEGPMGSAPHRADLPPVDTVKPQQRL